MPKYKLNRAAFRREVLKADFMLAEMEHRGNAVLRTAEAIAPRHTGRYSRSFRVRASRSGGVHRDRASALVYSTDPAAMSIEFGHTAPDGRRIGGHYTLTTALDSAGGHG